MISRITVLAPLAITLLLLAGGCSKGGSAAAADEVLTLPDGQQFKVESGGELQGMSITLLRKQPDGSWSKLGSANLDSPRHWLAVIRPQGSDKSRSLWVTSDGCVAVLAKDNECYLVYDTRKKTCVTGTDLEACSPFMLLNETAEPDLADTQRMLSDAKTGTHPTTGHPSKSSLEAALQSKNPKVGSLASELLNYYR